MMRILTKKRNIYFIGIGGIGMSGIAEILHEMKFLISGSDLNENNNTIRLKKLGIKINFGHFKENIKDKDIIVYSSAIKMSNPEIVEAENLNIPILPRAKILAEILFLRSSITVSGSHGKTTTTSLIACILEEAKLDPTVINGGIINTYETNAKLGHGDWIVAEADESDGSFKLLRSTICLINNIDPEHLDYYKTFKNLKEAFINYASKVPFYGFISMCIDHKVVRELKKSLKNKKIITYGFSKNANFSLKNKKIIERNGFFYNQFDVIINANDRIKNVLIPILGNHNLQNTLGAISVTRSIGIKKNIIKNALKKFKGVKRRFTLVDEVNGIKIFDDYAHHPKEIEATLSALKEISKNKIVVVYEPHRFSRLKSLFADFQNCFGNSTYLFILPVFSAGEKVNKIFDSAKLVNQLKIKKKNTFYISNNEDLFIELCKLLKPNDNLIFLGAGPITKIANSFPTYFKKKKNEVF
ncbi:MAG: UDP-N-acetylmuramate--L-alanine ligase [Rickettsiales bacterium]|nr:UDP-N-acetylmuramate--L-alanine ligase [Rickettsiales bacterium]